MLEGLLDFLLNLEVELEWDCYDLKRSAVFKGQCVDTQNIQSKKINTWLTHLLHF